MPKPNGRNAVGQRLAKRANQIDPKRAKLLELILEGKLRGDSLFLDASRIAPY